MYERYIKRLIDLIIALIGMPFFCIVFIFVAPAIIINDGFPVFYNAKRIGQNGKLFKMYKFRSMKNNSPDIRTESGDTYNCEDDPRVTKVGKFLRKTSVEGKVIIRQTTESLVNKGFCKVSPIHFFAGCNLIPDNLMMITA